MPNKPNSILNAFQRTNRIQVPIIQTKTIASFPLNSKPSPFPDSNNTIFEAHLSIYQFVLKNNLIPKLPYTPHNA